MAHNTVNQSNIRSNSAPTQNLSSVSQGYLWMLLPHQQFHQPQQLATSFFMQQYSQPCPFYPPRPFYQPQQSATPSSGQQNTSQLSQFCQPQQLATPSSGQQNNSQLSLFCQPQQMATPLSGQQNNSQLSQFCQPQQLATPSSGQQNNSQLSQFCQPQQLATPSSGQQNNSQLSQFCQPQQLATPSSGQRNNSQLSQFCQPQQLATPLSGQQNTSQLRQVYRPQQLATSSFSQQYPQQWQHGHQPAIKMELEDRTSSAIAGFTVGPERPEEAIQINGAAYAAKNSILKMIEDKEMKKMQEMKNAEWRRGAESTPSVKTEPDDEESEAEDTTRSSGHTQHLDKYKMDRSPRGLCIIFNTKNFSAESKLQKRLGTRKDVEALLDTFNDNLNFSTRVVQDPNSASYFKTLRKIARRDHSKYDCFVCIILSHGCEGYVYGTNGEMISINDLTGLFQGELAPSLEGKPKLFFIQACRKVVPQEAVPIQKDGPTMIANESDTLVSQATVSGFVSCRSAKLGSFYIGWLCKIINAYYKKEDLLSMLTMVNERMSRKALKVDGK